MRQRFVGTGKLLRDGTVIGEPRYDFSLTHSESDLPDVHGYLWMPVVGLPLPTDYAPLRLVLTGKRQSLALYVSGPIVDGSGQWRYAVHALDAPDQDHDSILRTIPR